jgi:hypothetical protein
MHNPPFCAFFGHPDALQRECTFVPPCFTQYPPLCACLGHPPGALQRLFSFMPLTYTRASRHFWLFSDTAPPDYAIRTRDPGESRAKNNRSSAPDVGLVQLGQPSFVQSSSQTLKRIYLPENAGISLLWGGRGRAKKRRGRA